MNIAICDDERVVREKLESTIRKYCEEAQCLEIWEITQFESGDILLQDKRKYDVYFLDLEMPGTDGIYVAKKLKQMFPECYIIIMTNHDGRMKEGYQVNAFRYMTKPILYEEVAEGLQTLMGQMIGNECVTLMRQGHEYDVQQKLIRYIYIEDGHSKIVVGKEVFQSELSLDKWERLLPDKLFVRAHKSYIVNLAKIESIEKDIVLSSGEKIICSRRKRKKMEEKFMEYDLEFGRRWS